MRPVAPYPKDTHTAQLIFKVEKRLPVPDVERLRPFDRERPWGIEPRLNSMFDTRPLQINAVKVAAPLILDHGGRRAMVIFKKIRLNCLPSPTTSSPPPRTSSSITRAGPVLIPADLDVVADRRRAGRIVLRDYFRI